MIHTIKTGRRSFLGTLAAAIASVLLPRKTVESADVVVQPKVFTCQPTVAELPSAADMVAERGSVQEPPEYKEVYDAKRGYVIGYMEWRFDSNEHRITRQEFTR